MVSFLNRLAWAVSILFAILPLFIDEELFLLSILILFISKGLVFSSKSIQEAVKMIWGTILPSQAVEQQVHVDDQSSTPLIQDTPTVIDSSSTTLTPTEWVLTVEDEPPKIVEPEAPSAFSLWLHNFFSDRPLAKIGGILLFLGALFFLFLIFAAVGSVWRVIIGILFWFFLIAVWVYLDKKEITTESRVLFGVGIAVNYLTILAWRHLLDGGMASDTLFSDVFATIALLLNTWLAIVLSLLYRSRVLLGFAFIFAYMTPFLVGSESSSAYLLIIYTTIITIALWSINMLSEQSKDKSEDKKDQDYIWGIAVVGMTILYSLVALDVSLWECIALFVWLFLSSIALLFFSYREKQSPVPIFIWAYIVLFASTVAGSTFFLLPFAIIGMMIIGIWFFLQATLSIMVLVFLGWASFFLGIFWFWLDGAESIGILFSIGVSILCLLSIVILRTSSLLLSLVSLGWFGLLCLLGIATLDTASVDPASLIMTKGMAIVLLVWASIFTFRLRDALIFFLSIIMSGILLIYPDSFENIPVLTSLAFFSYLVISLLVPYVLIRDESPLLRKAFLYGSLPIGALVVSYGIYQVGSKEFPWLALGLAYIWQALIYLMYAFFAGASFFPKTWSPLSTLSNDHKNNLLLLFALPLSLFTFSLAFVFSDIPGVMSLAWMIESAILYLVYTRLKDEKIFLFATFILLVGIIKEVSLIGTIDKREWDMFGILVIMMASLFSSLYILRKEIIASRLAYDVLHILAVIGISIGISEIIPTTGTGWSVLGPSFFVMILSFLYYSFGSRIQEWFLVVLLVGVSIMFIDRFSSLDKDVFPLMIQSFAMICILGSGYLWFRSGKYVGYINLGISLLSVLYISSCYIDFFFGIFAVSIYLTIIASLAIIRGVISDAPRLRTIGLYIGAFVLSKILFYDIWVGSDNLIIRVFALMISGGIMIYLSQLYGKYVSRGWSLEFSLSNVLWESSSASFTEEMKEGENPFRWELDMELTKVTVSHLSAVKFTPISWDAFTIKRASILRLATHITSTLGKKEFHPGELKWAYSYVLKNLESTMPEKDLTPLLEKFHHWIESGGSVEFIEKK
jgi:Predicted membrane protein (DUF2339)